VTCPFCESADVEEVSAWGGQIITRQMRCRACGSYFEAIRDEFAPAGRAATAPVTPAAPPAAPPPRAA
jgi:sarcosine oxidase delta subunit